jgi:hypothetical protein
LTVAIFRTISGDNMDPEYLFAEAFLDLHRRLDERTLYAAVRSAAILRQMFIEKHSLVAQAKKNHKVKLEFSVLLPLPVDFAAHGVPEPDIEFLGEQVEGTPDSMTRRNLTHDEFLAFPVARIGAQHVSVRDIIRFLANVRGGVHLGAPDPDQVVLTELEQNFSLLVADAHGNEEKVVPTTLTIRGIAKVALDGLRPLYESIFAAKHPSQRAFYILGFRREIPNDFPGRRGAMLANLISTPSEIGQFIAVPPTQFVFWSKGGPTPANLQPIATTLAYAGAQRARTPSLDEIPADTSLPFVVPETQPGAILPKAVVWRRSEQTPVRRIVRLEQEERDIFAIWWNENLTTLEFAVRRFRAALDCSWAAGMYGVALFTWEPGQIAITYGTILEENGYQQRTAVGK